MYTVCNSKTSNENLKKKQVIAMYVPGHVWYGAAIKAFSNMLV